MDNLEEKEELFNEKENTKKSKTSKSTGNRNKNRNKSARKKSSSTKSSKVEEKEVKDIDISPFVSNLEGNVYAITNLPEEFIATLFAWVSRSPKSFKEHLKIALKDQNVVSDIQSFQELDEKAKKFHEKWTVGYGHSCYDEETDVLTKEGFKRWKDVTMEDELASVDPETMEIEYLKPFRLIAEHYKGPMYKVNRNRVDMLVTPNHKIFAWPRHKIEGHATRQYQLIEAEKLAGKCYKIKLGGLKWEGEQIDELYGFPIEPLLQFYGFFIGDGYIDPRMNHAVSFHLYKQRKIDYLYSLCDVLGLTVARHKNNKFYVTGESRTGKSIGEIMATCYDKNHEKQIPSELFELHSELLLNLYDGLLNSDGHIGKTGEVYNTSSLKLVDQIQHLCVLLGWTSSVTLLHSAGNDRHKDNWKIFINKKLLESMINKVQYDLMDEWVEYDGMVYCAELPKYHTLIVRRNGRIHVSGNSVAEHAIAHVGIEKISRLASAELELSNSFYSITEYSQRYQRPKRGDWHNPFDLFVSHNGPTRDMKVNSLHDKFEVFMNQAFDTFEVLIDQLQTYMKSSDEYKDYSDNAIKKLAFEDARYVLPLAMYTQLGMTANGRAWRDGIVKLGVSDYEEVRNLANDLRTEISKVLPVLLKYAKPSQYQINSKKRIKSHFIGSFPVETWQPNARFIHLPSEEEAINLIIASWLLEHSGYSYKIALSYARSLDQETKNQIIADALHEMQFFDTPPNAFKNIHYKAEFLVSEANWHQLLRHNRKTDFTYNRPTPFFGVTIPPRIQEAGLSDMVLTIASESQNLYEEILCSDKPELADYVVLNAHKRRVMADFNLWEAYHLINLRTSEEAQWDIREAFEKLYSQLKQIHPNLIAQAQRRA